MIQQQIKSILPKSPPTQAFTSGESKELKIKKEATKASICSMREEVENDILGEIIVSQYYFSIARKYLSKVNFTPGINQLIWESSEALFPNLNYKSVVIEVMKRSSIDLDQFALYKLIGSMMSKFYVACPIEHKCMWLIELGIRDCIVQIAELDLISPKRLDLLEIMSDAMLLMGEHKTDTLAILSDTLTQLQVAAPEHPVTKKVLDLQELVDRKAEGLRSNLNSKS